MSKTYHIAQTNVATIRYPLEHPRMRGFVARLDDINALADVSAGFVWRLQSGNGIVTTDDPCLIVNMSVWETVEALFEFVYRTEHTKVMTRRRQWFERPDEAFQVLWWVESGHKPTVEEGLERLRHLRAHGPSERAFTFKTRFPSPAGEGAGGDDLVPEKHCVGWS